ncbi:proteinase inhibitor type-2 precursor [Solanum lycopersicum]|uniref:Proteinase inhibitor type-2 CEVI57 n=1 Tax=Solanum lycopersicum TaxID=4081 RepID=A0A3Q7FEG3_SOLLC|nr:proteinase inhibitor type-2 precursor [Solanum lycopersicum]
MAVHKQVSFLAYLLLVVGLLLLVSAVEHVDAKPCTMECGHLGFGICPRSQGSPQNPICTNCCSGFKGCNYYSVNGTFICEGQSDPRKPKPCPLNCDPHIAYSKCPRSGGKTFIYPTGCTTCCTGYKGCYYFGKDGKFVCEGESDEPKACTMECDPRVAYMICPSSGLAKLSQVCVNCCTAGDGCKLYGYDGSLICTGEPQSYISTA